MKKLLTLLLTLLAADICAAEKPLIRIHTDQTDLLYRCLLYTSDAADE